MVTTGTPIASGRRNGDIEKPVVIVTSMRLSMPINGDDVYIKTVMEDQSCGFNSVRLPFHFVPGGARGRTSSTFSSFIFIEGDSDR